MKCLALVFLTLLASSALAAPQFTGVATHYKRRSAPWATCPAPFTEQDREAVKDEAAKRAHRACHEAGHGVCFTRETRLVGPCGCGWATNSCVASSIVEAVDLGSEKP